MTYYTYRQGTSRGRDTYGYNIVTLTNANTGKRYSTNGGGYDMLGSVTGDILNTEYQDKLKELHALAENFSIDGTGDFQTRRAHEKDGSLGRSPDYTKHYYGLCAYYNADGIVRRVALDGATGFSNCQTIARALGLELALNYEKRLRRSNWKILDIEIKPLEGLDRAMAEQALYHGQTLDGHRAASEGMAKLCEAVAEGDE